MIYIVLCLYFQSAISPFLQEVFMPVVSTIFQVLALPTDDLDQVAVADKQSLQKSYYQFISTIVTNDVLDVLRNQGKSLANFCVLVPCSQSVSILRLEFSDLIYFKLNQLYLQLHYKTVSNDCLKLMSNPNISYLYTF